MDLNRQGHDHHLQWSAKKHEHEQAAMQKARN